MAYQAFHALLYFSTDATLIQLAVLFWIYSTLHTLFTRQVPLTPFEPLPLKNLPLSLLSSSAFPRHKNLPLTFYMLKDSTMPSLSSLSPSSMLFSPPSFFCSRKVNDQLFTQITPFPLAYPEPIKWQPPSSTASLQSMSSKICLLTETIQSLEALFKERTPIPPLSLPLICTRSEPC